MRVLLFLLFFTFVLNLKGQEDRFYIRTHSTDIEIPVTAEDSIVRYTGDDKRLQKLFKSHRVKVFRKDFKYAERDKLKRTYFVIANSKDFQRALLKETKDLFEFGESINSERLKIFEPNDYGVTSTIGESFGAAANLDYFDFLGVPEAWYYTTGSRKVIIGISDASVDIEDPEFKGKIKKFKRSSYSSGHGMSVAATAAAQGNNGYGTAGVCYDCSLYTTNYGDFQQFRQLLELAKAGAKVINCSWGSTRYYDTAQEVINEIRDLGTVIVSVPHNKSYSETNGEKIYYPGGYEHVISVGAIQHRYHDIADNIKIQEKNGRYYAASIKYHLGRTGGFKKNDPKEEYFIYKTSTSNMDHSVDVMAPGNFIFRYGPYAKDGEVLDNPFSATSPAAPLVTGTIGLMFSLNPCLTVDEVNSIIKLSATNIDHIKANKPFAGKYGAGSLHTGRAVKMVYDMLQPNNYMVLENQNFTRWNFVLNAPYKIKLQNERFAEDARVHFTAKEAILIEGETVFLPGENGAVYLGIDSNAAYTCKDSSQ